MQETILVTGATGTVGREAIKQLALLDVKVRAGVHSIIKGENLKRLPGVEVVEMEFERPDSLKAAFTHADRLFLITPFTLDQVQQAKTLVDEAKAAGVKHIVRLSVLGADAEPGIQLSRWHREVEEYIEQSSIAYTHVRPAGFMQNFLMFAESISQDGKVYLPTGGGKVSYMDARDVAAVAVEALTGTGHEGEVYEITGPEAISHADAADMLSEATGKQIDYVDVPEEAAREALLSKQIPEQLVDAMLELYSLYKADGASDVNNTVRQLIGREPHSFRQFANDYKSCF